MKSVSVGEKGFGGSGSGVGSIRWGCTRVGVSMNSGSRG